MGVWQVRVSGRLGLYRYEMMVGDNSTVGERVEGRVNNGEPTALCNMNTYNMKRDWEETEKRDDCDRYFDASSDANFFGVAASIFLCDDVLILELSAKELSLVLQRLSLFTQCTQFDFN